MGGGAFLVFIVAFVVCAGTLGALFITGEELRILGRPGEQRARVQPKSATQPDAAQGEAAPKGEDWVGEPSDADAEGDEDEEDEEAADPEAVRDSRVQVMKFLEGSLEDISENGHRLDGFTKFGCHLFLAGACEIAAQKGGLNHKQMFDILEGGVEILGTKKEMAEQFSEKYEEYLLEPKYTRMFKSGRDAMQRFFQGAGDANTLLTKAVERWKQTGTDDDDKHTGPMTVMFTDIVGSTRMNQTRGDEVAQIVVRAHNDIVRGALERYDGLEIKHTGDGIMASFKNTVNAVESCIDMQRNCAAHNASDPEHALEICMGLNAGEPIAEDGDLFGATVQLAARICDKASGGQILTAGVVRELCAGKLVTFEKGSEYEMKGIEGLVPTYLVPWEE